MKRWRNRRCWVRKSFVASLVLTRKDTEHETTHLLCNAPTRTSLSRSGKMAVSWEISSSDGALTPAARSARPVSSSTHSRITEGFALAVAAPAPAPALPPPGTALARSGNGESGPWKNRPVRGVLRAVVTTSSFSCTAVDRAFAPVPALVVPSSGRARFVRRGGLSEPMRGRMKRCEKLTIPGEMRYALRPARSER